MALSSKTDRSDPGTSPQKRVRADRLNLTDEECALLPDPDWVTEDDADFIIARRAEREPGKRASLEQVLRENGIKSPLRIGYIAAPAVNPKKQPLRATKKSPPCYTRLNSSPLRAGNLSGWAIGRKMRLRKRFGDLRKTLFLKVRWSYKAIVGFIGFAAAGMFTASCKESPRSSAR